jgi:regulator of sigma E protease
MLSFLLFLLILSVLVLIHEAGHFFAARWSGVKAEEFGYGFPPRALGFVRVDGAWKRVKRTDQRTYKNTIWSINALPLGGFVRLKGEQGESVGEVDSFSSATLGKRFFIVAAGVMMNWLLATLIFIVGFTVGVPAQLDGLPAQAIVRDQKVQFVSILADGPAAKAGLAVGDFLLKINGQGEATAAQMREKMLQAGAKQETLRLTVEQKGITQELTVVPTYLEQIHQPGLGVALADTGIVRFSFGEAIVNGVRTSVQYTWAILTGFGQLIQSLFGDRKLASEVSGPVGIAVMTSQLAKQGTWTILHFMAMLSLNLAVINFLPIPALDGGRALFLLFETVRRRKITPRLEAIVHSIGFLGLMALILLVTIKDVRQYGGLIWNGVRSMIGF